MESNYSFSFPKNQSGDVVHIAEVGEKEGFQITATEESQKGLLSIIAKVLPQVNF